jgi:hypothetical protein
MLKIGKKVKFRNSYNLPDLTGTGTIISETHGFFSVKMDNKLDVVIHAVTETELVAARGRPRKI